MGSEGKYRGCGTWLPDFSFFPLIALVIPFLLHAFCDPEESIGGVVLGRHVNFPPIYP